ncbi:mCG62186, partial [Mus musculus]
PFPLASARAQDAGIPSATLRPSWGWFPTASGSPRHQGSRHSPSFRMGLPGSQHHQGKPLRKPWAQSEPLESV